MPDLPARFATVILAFAPLFCHRTWCHAEVLLVGAILAHGKRTVTSILRISGLSREHHFVNFHCVLSRARWSGREPAQLLLDLLIRTLVPTGPVILGVDNTIERRRGKRIKAEGIYSDPVPSDAHFVKASGLRWISLMLLAPIPWPARTWALPFLTALAPSERYCHERGQRHKKLTDWARQMVLQVRHWLPDRELVLVADMGFAALELLAALSRRGVICITRLRLDAALYEPAPLRQPETKGRPRTKGTRLPNLSDVLTRASTRWRRVTVPGWYGEGDRVVELCSATAVWRHGGLPIVPNRWVLLRDPLSRFSPQALLCTDPMRDPLQIIRWFILRWQIEVPFQEARTHLGVETQRQWSDRAVARTTPCLFGLFSIVTLLAGQLNRQTRTAVLTDRWYRKSHPTLRMLWQPCGSRFAMKRVYSCPTTGAKRQNPLRPFNDAWLTHSAMLPGWPKSSLEPVPKLCAS